VRKKNPHSITATVTSFAVASLLLLCFSNSFRIPWYTLFSVLISGFVLLLRFMFDLGA
jgi:hypothetical protein